MNIGGTDIQKKVALMSVATFGGGAIVWGIVAFLGWLNRKNPTGRGMNWLVGRLLLLMLALFAAGIAAPARSPRTRWASSSRCRSFSD